MVALYNKVVELAATFDVDSQRSKTRGNDVNVELLFHSLRTTDEVHKLTRAISTRF